MSGKIDWSKAPEWAKWHGLAGEKKSQVWFDDEKYSYVDGQQDGKAFFYCDACTYSSQDFSNVTFRPITRSWSGECLPPVGVVCEFLRLDDCQKETLENGSTVKIIAHYDGMNGQRVAAFTYDHRHGRDVESAISECFRPIRTPEQIEADEREAAISSMIQIMCETSGGRTYQAEALYDAGFRKP